VFFGQKYLPSFNQPIQPEKMNKYYSIFQTGLIIFLLLVVSCGDDDEEENYDLDYKQEMRDFVSAISDYAKDVNPDFLIVPQNGQEVNTINGDNEGDPDTDYLSSIDCIGQEDLYYGYDKDDRATSTGNTSYLMKFLNQIIKDSQRKIEIDELNPKEEESVLALFEKKFADFHNLKKFDIKSLDWDESLIDRARQQLYSISSKYTD